jgi:RHS repeat-associated protein
MTKYEVFAEHQKTNKNQVRQTGNYYYGARYYNPKWSTWLSVDPLVEETMDAYAYCYQNPINFVDPTGMSGEGANNEYTIYKNKDGLVIKKEYTGNKGGDEIDYIKEVNVDETTVSKDYINEYSIPVEKEYTAGKPNNYEAAQKENPTPGHRKVHDKNTDLAAYEFIANIFSGGSTQTASVVLRAAVKQVGKEVAKKFLSNQTQTNSKTLWKGKGKERIDVENPNPSQRVGQVHYQDNNGNKYIYDPSKGAFNNAPDKVNKLLKNQDFKTGIEKGLKYLGY